MTEKPFFKRTEKIGTIQSLWSGYGQIVRVKDIEDPSKTYIIKNIQFPSVSDHPRGWNTNYSHERKVKSYKIEIAWYKKWANRCNDRCYVPNCLHTSNDTEKHQIVLEDLDASGFSVRRAKLSVQEAKLVLSWLANFHATFMNEEPTDLWTEGTYWHLATRPDEFKSMKEGVLKAKAKELDALLRNCQFKTIVHGDAKVANFCFSLDMKKVAAVDFQYVGGGCGMKDVSYFLGSCLDAKACEEYEEELLDHYFKELKTALEIKKREICFSSLEKEWRKLYVIAWADFIRFIEGWMPQHQKNNAFGKQMVKRALSTF